MEVLPCPSRDDWARFSAGAVEYNRLEAMASHLDLCESCRDLVAGLDQAPDPLILSLLGASAQMPICPRPAGQGSSVLDRLVVREVLGFGGSSIVYRAFDPQRGGDVALKIVLPHVARDPEWRRRFLAEGRLTELDHPHLARVIESGECGEWAYLLLEYCSGPSLASWLENRVPSTGHALPASVAGQLVADLASATDYLHKKGIIHRDINPNNVLLTRPSAHDAAGSVFGYTVKLADFGLAKSQPGHTPSSEEADQTQSDVLMGTPDYIAPELLRDGSRAADSRSDIFALGVLLYRLLTGRAPFRGRTPLETLRNIERCQFVSPRRLRADVTPDLETIVLKCLQEFPANRYPTAALLHQDLVSLLAGRPIHARRPGPFSRLAGHARRQPVVAAALGLAFLPVLALVLGVSIPRSGAALGEERADALVRDERRRHDADMEQAWNVWRRGDIDQAQDIVRRWFPGDPSPRDVRGAEWHTLNGLTHFTAKVCRLDKRTMGNIYVAAFSPDGSVLALGGATGRIALWDMGTGGAIAMLEGHRGDVNGLAYSPDGRLLASSGDDGTLRLWEVARKRPFRALSGPGPRIFDVAFSPDGFWIAAGGDGPEVWLWRPGDESPRKRLAVGPLKALAFGPDSRRLATGDRVGRVAIWDLVDEKPTKTVVPVKDETINDLAFTPEGQRLVVSVMGSPTLVLDVTSLRILSRIGTAGAPLETLAVAPDGKRIGTVFKDGFVRLWEFDGRMQAGWKTLIDTTHVTRPHSLVFAPDGRSAAITGNHGFFWLADLRGLP